MRVYSWASLMLSNDSHLMVELVVQAFERENPLMLYPGQVLVVNRAYIGEIKLVGPIGGSFSPYEGVTVAWVPYDPDLVGQAPPDVSNTSATALYTVPSQKNMVVQGAANPQGAAYVAKMFSNLGNSGSYTIKSNGLLILQLAGAGTTASVTINGTSYTLNSGNALTNGALYEFAIHVLQGDSVSVSGATVVRAIEVIEG
ncbi:MAG: hypothetical protein C0167_00305 [Nitrososphaera sp.]|nr:MAG: hypothetical protein C0167_00305 [Nitrososphaera sp.]